ncbi:MAG: Rne/Rng family ribonuclease [Deltaproteobacteria bacterium]|nr:Rne/Rng family ribonuclease [Deltaproteobacteria bacterium]
MAHELIMNVTPGETRIARLEDGAVHELFIERADDQQIVGNVYKGIVNRVLPGMQAAFLDIGLEKAAFLYVTDVIPDLFEGMDDDEEEGAEATAGAEQTAPQGKPEPRDPRGAGRDPRGASRRRRRGPVPPIESVLKEGQHLVVQVAKQPIRTKGARITCHISFPGRYVVAMPTVDHVGVSRRIGSYEERMRLKKILVESRTSKTGFIARTISIGAPEEALKADLANLQAIWAGIAQKQDKAKPPALLYQDLGLVLRSVRDLMSPDLDRLVIDSAEDYREVMAFMEKFMPDLANRVELYDKETPIFDVYGIETEINRALGKKVWLKSGGYLVVDQSEALTAIDINTGRFVGRDDFEDTILQTNLEAAEEIAYQLRLRNIGGIIIIDFIDMERFGNRQKVFQTFKDALRRDKVKTTITKISDLGLVEMTRKRTRDSLTQQITEPCYHCHGIGHVKTPTTVAFELFRELKRTFAHLNGGRSIVVQTHPRVAQVLFNEERERLDAMEKRFQKRIVIETSDTAPIEKFEISTR